MFNPAKIMFMMMLMMGTLISISSNSWFLAWLGMEMNLLGFIPLLISNYNKYSTEAAMKYFFVQASSSSILIISVLNPYKLIMETPLLTLMALWIKLGMAPFHFWIPSTAENIKSFPLFILLTWQKITPLFLISFYKLDLVKTLFPIIMSAMMGSLGGITQTSIKKIISFSSISHMAWVLSSMLLNLNLTLSYFLAYSAIIMLTISLCNMTKLSHVNQTLFLNKMNKINLFIIMMSLGGMPPFMTFFPKLMITIMLMQNNMMFLAFILLVSSMLNLYFYLRLSYSSITNMHFSIKSNKSTTFFFPLTMITFSMTSIIMLM